MWFQKGLDSKTSPLRCEIYRIGLLDESIPPSKPSPADRYSESWVKSGIIITRVQERKEKQKMTYLLGAPVLVADILAALEKLKDLLDSSLLLLELLHLERLTTTASLLDKVLMGLLDELNILDTELFANDLEITNRVDIALDVNNLGVVKASDDLEDGIDGADVGQESVTKTGTSRGTTGQTGNIVDGKVGRYLRLGLVVLAQPIEALVRDNDTRLLGVNGSVREVLSLSQYAAS